MENKDASFIKESLDSECAGCGKCCYTDKGNPCKYLSNTMRCQIYNVRIMANCGDSNNCGYIKERGGCRGGKPIN